MDGIDILLLGQVDDGFNVQVACNRLHIRYSHLESAGVNFAIIAQMLSRSLLNTENKALKWRYNVLAISQIVTSRRVVMYDF